MERSLGDYNIIKQIGQGSLGTVYLAEHRFMKQQYVLKVLPEELATDRSFIQRFEEDVMLLSVLDHPAIVKIHNVSFNQGLYFLVTDCVVDNMGETTNLAQYLVARGSRLEEEELFRLLIQIADALDYAHGKNLVHRGVKLNNILMGKQGKSGLEFYLSDFGLSHIVGTGAVLTRNYRAVGEALGLGATLGSPKIGVERYPNPPIDWQKLSPLQGSFLQNFAFLAPEQKRIENGPEVDAKADIYAFGVLAYYLTVGEFPEGVFALPSTKSRDYNWNWDALVLRCLQSDPEKRPDSLVAALEEIKDPQKKSQVKSFELLEQLVAEQPQLVEATLSKEAGTTTRQSFPFKPVLHNPQIERPNTDHDPAAVFQVDTTVKTYSPERRDTNNIQPILTDMVLIEGGNFFLGCNEGNRDEMPHHQVTLSSFAIDIHPVTNEQFVRFLEVMGGEKDSNHNDIIRLRESRIKRSAGKISIESGYGKHPVVGVTWYGAVAYAKWIGKRLPTEAEWEIAMCGGNDNTLYPTGEEIEKSQANFFSSDTTAVMSYAPNGYGLYDMAGNVYEWCHDWYGYNYYEISVQEPENPKGPLQGVYRVLRGGCWKSLKEDLRCSRRHRNNPGTVNGTYGFRCAADVEPT
jgi:formylglycine-generating enzyme required for sulfatase activity